MTTVAFEDGTSVPVGTVYCIGRNYARHAAELGNAVPTDPVVFLKAATAVRGLGSAPVAYDESFHHEVELVLLVGSDVALGADPGWAAVAGVALGLDLTRRLVQQRCKDAGLPWTAAKSFAGAAVVGPFLPPDTLGDPAALTLALALDGVVRQRGRVSEMVFPVPTLIGALARMAPLRRGDLVFTGTPDGVGPIRVGDEFAMTLTGPAGTRRWAGVL